LRIMKALLLASGVSLAFGQDTSCFQRASANCTAFGLNCTLSAGSCTRAGSAPVCNTSSTACPTANCADAAFVVNGKTCSKCFDACSTFSSNGTCAVNANCQWNQPFCFNTPPPPTPAPAQPCTHADQSSCTGETNCMWAAFTATQCGQTLPNQGVCTQCNGTYAPLRGPAFNNV